MLASRFRHGGARRLFFYDRGSSQRGCGLFRTGNIYVEPPKDIGCSGGSGHVSRAKITANYEHRTGKKAWTQVPRSHLLRLCWTFPIPDRCTLFNNVSSAADATGGKYNHGREEKKIGDTISDPITEVSAISRERVNLYVVAKEFRNYCRLIQLDMRLSGAAMTATTLEKKKNGNGRARRCRRPPTGQLAM